MIGLGRQVCRLLALLTAVSVVIAVEHDGVLCADDNIPVCASYRGEHLLFKNECDLRKTQRENLMGSPLFDVALHYCLPSCEFECDDNSQPICGLSVASGERKSFRNRCEMVRNACLSKSEWLVYKWGMCPKQQQQEPLPCTNLYRPVCATYAGVKSTFANECLVNAENLRTKKDWRIISEGICGEDSIKMKHKPKLMPKTKPNVEIKRSKRRSSKSPINQLDDFEIPEEAVEIFAPSTFHTQFISNTGITMDKSYSLPARTPQLTQSQAKAKPGMYGNNEYGREVKHCVFSNEPVCGSFNGETRTFSDVCALMEYSQMVGNAWAVLYEGSCRRCDKPCCPTLYSPICVNRNGISYTIINECYLERVRCKDPNSVWKIMHKGECSAPAAEAAHSIPAPKPMTSLLGVPEMLYAGKHNQETTTTYKPRLESKTTTKATYSEELNTNNYDKDLHIQTIQMPATSKLWTFKDSLEPRIPKDKFNKRRPSSKKANSEVYSKNHLLLTTTTPTTAATAPTASLKELTEKDFLNIDMKSASELFGEIEADSEILHLMDTTSDAARETKTEATTTAATTLLTTTPAAPATTTATPNTSEKTNSENKYKASYKNATTSNSDKQEEQTSIYGSVRNSLIMRLLRARSAKNVV